MTKVFHISVRMPACPGPGPDPSASVWAYTWKLSGVYLLMTSRLYIFVIEGLLNEAMSQ